MNLDKEMKKLAELGDILNSTIQKTETEINRIAPKEGETVLGFIGELKEVKTSGKGIEELQEKLKDYENNKQ